MRLNEIPFKRALVVNLSSDIVKLDDKKDVIYSEKQLSSSSTRPYFKSFTGMFGFLKTYGDAIDFIITNGVNVGSIKSIEKVIKEHKIEKLAFSKNIGTLNYSFFDKKFNIKLSKEQFLAILKGALNDVEMYEMENEGVLYVFIKKG